MAVHRTFCRFCNAACGALVTVDEDGAVVDIRGDREHPISAGYLCPKGRAMGAQVTHPARLREPRFGRGREGRPGWDGVLDDLATQIDGAIAVAGPRGLGMYKGTAHYLESAAVALGPAILAGVGSDSWYTTLSVDCPAVTLVAELVTGHPWHLPVPDLDATFILMVGTNPVASHGHTFNLSRPTWWLRRWAREGELWVVDPRRSESADHATEHLAVRPGSDVVLLAHLVREMLRDGADREYLATATTGVDELRAAVEPFTRERAEAATGIDGHRIDLLLERMRAHGKVAVVTGTGLNFQSSANAAVWMAWMLSAVTGALDRRGGLWFNPGYLSQVHVNRRPVLDGSPAPGPASRPDLCGRFGELPCAALVDEIEAGNLRALVVVGGNPLIALPQTERVIAAFRSLDVLAVVDVIEGPLTDLATHVLPATVQLERADIPTGPEVYALESFSQVTDRVVPIVGDQRPTWWILAQLARRLGVATDTAFDRDPADEPALLDALYGADGARWQALRAGPTAVVDDARPHGWVQEGRPGGRFPLAPPLLVEELAGVTDPGDASSLRAISGRLLRKMNSTLADGHGLRQGAMPGARLHPETAAGIGVRDGDHVRVVGADGSLETDAVLDERMSPGVVALPHGFAEANAARLTGDSPEAVDPQSGMPTTTALEVTVERM